MNLDSEEVEIALRVLQQISENPSLIDRHDRFKSLVAKIYKQGKKQQKQIEKEKQQQQDRNLQAQTLIVRDRSSSCNSLLPTREIKKSIGTLQQAKNCYICKQSYTEVHFFYHLLCPQCAEFNYQKRQQSTNLQGRVALITGGRIKIGYQLALKMLRDGAKVIITTRFVADALLRFSEEEDFLQWRDRLFLYALDLRNIPAVEEFIQYLFATESALDIIINNAAQTIKRPLAFYQHLLDKEEDILDSPTGNNRNILSKLQRPILLEAAPQYNNYLVDNIYFPINQRDRDGQQLDKRPINSWQLKLDGVETREMLEVQLVNNIAPFILNSKLKPLLMRAQFSERFIINVSAMEGQFNRRSKTSFHPHTNMAKAALNMMTRTSAQDYAEASIYMNSVDTGWITDENPYPKKTRLHENKGFYTPLDAIDGMARIYDPIVQGINHKEFIFGQFLKDYTSYPW